MVNVEHVMIEGIPALEVTTAENVGKKLPLFIYCHGWTNYKESVLMHAYMIARENFRVILPDAYLHGERTNAQLAEDRFEVFWPVVKQSVKEIDIIKNHYVESDLTAADSVSIGGQSMGGITALAAFTVYDWLHSAVCLMGTPAIKAFADGMLQMPRFADMGGALDAIAQELSDIPTYDLSMQPEKINHRPLMFWHGTADDWVPYELSKGFYDLVKKESYADHVEFHTSEGVGHEVTYGTVVKTIDFLNRTK